MDCSLPCSSVRGNISRQEYWRGLPFHSPQDLGDPGNEPGPTSLQADSLASEPGGAETCYSAQFSSVQLLSHVRLFATPWTAARQASLSITNAWSLLKLMSIELVTPSNHLILCHALLPRLKSFPASVSFPMSQFFASGGQSIGASASASVPPMNSQDLFPLGQTDWIS